MIVSAFSASRNGGREMPKATVICASVGIWSPDFRLPDLIIAMIRLATCTAIEPRLIPGSR